MTEMSFLDHLQELRQRLIVCIVALFIAAAVSWPLSPMVQRFIQRPLLDLVFLGPRALPRFVQPLGPESGTPQDQAP